MNKSVFLVMRDITQSKKKKQMNIGDLDLKMALLTVMLSLAVFIYLMTTSIIR